MLCTRRVFSLEMGTGWGTRRAGLVATKDHTNIRGLVTAFTALHRFVAGLPRSRLTIAGSAPDKLLIWRGDALHQRFDLLAFTSSAWRDSPQTSCTSTGYPPPARSWASSRARPDASCRGACAPCHRVLMNR